LNIIVLRAIILALFSAFFLTYAAMEVIMISTRRFAARTESRIKPSVIVLLMPPYSRKVAGIRRILNPAPPRLARDEFRYFIDSLGQQHFNFRQQVWLNVSVEMAFTHVYSTALNTLAVNLLTIATRKRDYPAAVGRTSRGAISLAPAFCRECLLSAPPHAWALPISTIRAWLKTNRKRGRI
jgi:hypothetical protein